MEITRVKKSEEEIDTKEVDTLEEDGANEQPDRTRELEIELARKEGELKALKNISTSNGQMTLEQTKSAVFADINNLSDEDFHKKYPQHNKHSAMMAVMDASEKQTKAETKQLHAESTAAAELSAKYGQEFYRLKERILEDAGDLAETARQDPQKLTRWMERQFLALSHEKPASKKADDRRKVAADFEKPTVIARKEESSVGDNENDDVKDEIPEGSDISSQKLAGFLNIRSEKERKEISSKWRPGTEKNEQIAYVDMDLTCGDPYAKEKVLYRDPKRGFERVKIA